MRNVVEKQKIACRRLFKRLGKGAVYLWVSTILLGGMDSAPARGRTGANEESEMKADANAVLQGGREKLETEVAELKRLLKENASTPVVSKKDSAAASESSAADVISSGIEANQVNNVPSSLSPDDRKTFDFLHDSTINVGLDAYYMYNFNHPVGRVNLLRAYDV